MQPYVGPFPVVGRPSHSTIQVKVGTFKSGVDNVQVHHWQNCEPAFMRADAEEGVMPTRGRPKKSDTSSPSDLQPATEAPQAETPPPSKPVEPESEPDSVKNNKKVNKAPTRRSERIMARSHATSIAECRVQAFPAKSPGNSNVMWSASVDSIAEINRDINSAYYKNWAKSVTTN